MARNKSKNPSRQQPLLSSEDLADTLAANSMLNDVQSSDANSNDAASNEDLHFDNVPSEMPQLLSFLTIMLVSQQQQMRLYEKQMQLLSKQISCKTESPHSAPPMDRVPLADYPKFSEIVTSDDSIQYLGFPKSSLSDEDILICRAF